RRLPADGDRVRPVPPPRPPARGHRPGRREGRVRPRDGDRDAAGDRRRPCAERRANGDRGRAEMTDLAFELPDEPTGDVELPAVLPVLPLKEMVVFPQSMTPLAIGQERSVRLIDDVVAGDRLLALVTTRDSSIETPGWDDIYEIGTVA